MFVGSEQNTKSIEAGTCDRTVKGGIFDSLYQMKLSQYGNILEKEDWYNKDEWAMGLCFGRLSFSSSSTSDGVDEWNIPSFDST